MDQATLHAMLTQDLEEIKRANLLEEIPRIGGTPRIEGWNDTLLMTLRDGVKFNNNILNHRKLKDNLN